jgi:hypothetical protein
MHSLAEIINFNLEHPELCLPPSMSSQPHFNAFFPNFHQHVPTKTISWPPSKRPPNVKKSTPHANISKLPVAPMASTTSSLRNNSTSSLHLATHPSPPLQQQPATPQPPVPCPL